MEGWRLEDGGWKLEDGRGMLVSAPAFDRHG
jgi:hypothetical protein